MDYSQLDRRWKNTLLGDSKTATIGTDGCTVTSLTNLLNRVFGLNLKPTDVNSELQNKKAFLDKTGLIIWSRVQLAFPQLKWIYRDYNYNNIRVSHYVYLKRLPVLVEVNNHGTKHWLLFIGSQRLIDPLDGKMYSTNKYPLTGDSVFDRA